MMRWPWVNGRGLKQVESGLALIGRPWEFDAREAIRFGQLDLIVVKITNLRSRDFGNGGIMGLVILGAAEKNDEN